MFTLTARDRHGVMILQLPRGKNNGGIKVLSPTITSNFWQENNYLLECDCYLVSIRKLTPKECWRLMGFDDDCFKKAEQVNSNSQLYKQAGNSIVVNVLVEILKIFMRLGEN